MFQLKSLFEHVNYTCIQGSMEKEVTDVFTDSRKVISESMYICIHGEKFNGHDAAVDVIRQGASVLVIEEAVAKEIYDREEVTIIQVENTRYAMACIAASYYGNPANQLKVIGITGTKGKTTTTYLIKDILEKAGHQVGLIGTIETIIKDKTIPASHTTPEAFELQKSFRQMLDAGCDICVMEASSQGFKMHRTAGFTFEIGIFTNLSRDHISPSEHATMEEYIEMKGRLLQQCKLGIANVDDPYFEEVTRGHLCKLETFGFSEKAMLRAKEVSLFTGQGYLGVHFQTEGNVEMPVTLHSPGIFSVYNALTAIAVCRHFQIKEEIIQEALLQAKVKGRIELVKVSEDFTLLIDYAHNAMSLSSILTSLREYKPQRLVCLFGCGGNRSRERRFEMGEVSGKLADLTIITSDNPRYEEPEAIIEDIKTGIEKTKGSYVDIIDRKEAIRYAISHGEKGDIIVLAGKGHEDYQEIKGVKYPMDERILIQEILEEMKSM